MADIIVFIGPTLAINDAANLLDAKFLPPATQGDVYRAALEKPKAIGLIDGCFGDVPAVAHKEILWALSQGIDVYGSSSMGALRAAELTPFGMVGIGEIYAAYRDGQLEDDDEVALAHAPYDMNYLALSEPMVNIRWTLDLAKKQGIIPASKYNELINLAKGCYFTERSYSRLINDAKEKNTLAIEEATSLCDWLAEHKVDQKRKDAIELLEFLAGDFKNGAPCVLPFEFQHTLSWEALSKYAIKYK